MKGLIFTYLLTYGGASVSLISPFHGLLAYVCFAIIKPDALWPWSVPAGNYSRIVALAMLFGWSYTTKATFKSGRGAAVFALLFFFWIWAIIGAFGAPHQKEAWEFVEAMAKIVIPVLIGMTTIDSIDKLKQLAWTIVISQGYVAFELNMSYFRGYNTLHTTGFGGLDNNSAAIALVTALGLTFFLALHSEKLWQKGLAFVIAAFMAHAVLFSFSREGMVAMIISSIAAFFVIPKKPKTYLAFALAVAAGIYAAGPEVRARFMTSFSKKDGQREASAQSRLDLWEDCWDVMQKQPLWGCGPNHWPLTAPNYGWPLGKEAHSLWMQTGAELGFLGLGLLVSYYVLCIWRLYPLPRMKNEVDDEWHRYFARMTITSLIGFLIAAQFVSLESLEIPYYVCLIGIGTLKLASTPSKDSAWDVAPLDTVVPDRPNLETRQIEHGALAP